MISELIGSEILHSVLYITFGSGLYCLLFFVFLGDFWEWVSLQSNLVIIELLSSIFSRQWGFPTSGEIYTQ